MAADAAVLKAAMETRFPNLRMRVALDIGSKVAKGEMKWGEKDGGSESVIRKVATACVQRASPGARTPQRNRNELVERP